MKIKDYILATIDEGLVHIPQLFGHNTTQLYGSHDQAKVNKINDIHNKMRSIVSAHDSAAGEHMHDNYSLDHLNQDEKFTIQEYTGSISGPTNRHLLKPMAEQLKEHAKVAYDIERNYSNSSQEERDRLLHKWSPLNIHGKNIKKLDDIFKHKAHTLKEDLHVYSGIGFDPSEHFKEGNGVFHSPAFLSTSVGVSTPKSFGQAFASKDAHHDQWDDEYTAKDNASVVKQGSRSEQDKHIIHFHLPKGYSGGMHIAPESKFPEEREFLLNRNQKWKLVNHEVHTTKDHTRYRTFVPSRKSVWDPTVEHPASRKYETYLTKQRNHIWTVVPHDAQIDEAKIHTPHYFSGVNYRKINWNTFQQESDTKSNPLRDSPHDDEISDEQASHIKADKDPEYDYNALHTYTQGSHHINMQAIDGAIHDTHRSLDKTIDDHSKPLHEDIHVYSGSGFDPTEHFKHGNGVIHLNAYTSTTLSPSMSMGFGLRAPGSKPTTARNHYSFERHIFHFHLPKGSQHGAYIDHLSTHGGEKEYLLHRGQKWKLTKHDTVKSRDVTKYTSWTGSGHPTNKTDYVTHIWSLEPHND